MAILSPSLMAQPQKKGGIGKTGGTGRLLITVNVLGSAGPIRFLVNAEELVAVVINTVLRSYARQGRLPVLGSDLNNFFLYSTNDGSDALSPWETIGSRGCRTFVLCKKPEVIDERKSQAPTQELGKKRTGSWKAWLNKSLNFKVSSH